MVSTRPSCPLTLKAGLQGIHPLRRPTKYKCSLSAILSWACALLQSASSLELPRRHRTLPGTIGRHGSSHEVCSPSAFPRSQQQHVGRVCLTRPLASSGFLDLSTLFVSAASLPALFHAGSAHGVAPFRAFLPPRGRTPSPTPIPSWCWSLLVTISTSRSRSHPRRPKPPRIRLAENLHARAEALTIRTAAAHPAGTEAPPSRTVARPSRAETPSSRTVALLSGAETPSSRTVTRVRRRRSAVETEHPPDPTKPKLR